MKKSVCIFVSKNSRPDLYINILGYCLARFGKENISNIFLLNVFDFPLDREKELIRLDSIKNNIVEQTSSLANNKYLKWNRQINDFEKEPIQFDTPPHFNLYKDLELLCSKENIFTKTLLNEEIDLELKLILQQSLGEYIFDITGLINRYLVNISLFLSDNNYDFFSFEMRKKNMTYNHLDLIHNLDEDDFRYIKLSSDLYKVIKQEEFQNLNPTNHDNIFDNWIKMIGSAKTEKVIGEIIDYSLQTNKKGLLSEIVQISSRWKMIKQDNINGVVNTNEFYTEANKVNNSLKDLIFSEFAK